MAFKVSNTTVVSSATAPGVASGTFFAANIQGSIGFASADDGYMGQNYGYSSGGIEIPGNVVNIIDKFPFANDANAADVGDLTVVRFGVAGHSSLSDGYTTGYGNIIDRFPFATNASATDVGDTITSFPAYAGGNSSLSHGYTNGAQYQDKFPFSTTVNSVNLSSSIPSQPRLGTGNQSSTSHGYISGGVPTGNNQVDKFPFATDSSTSLVGALSSARYFTTGNSSSTHGYNSGGEGSNVIDKFPFANDANAADVGDSTVSHTRCSSTGQNSTLSGYRTGGYNVSAPSLDKINSANLIEKFSFVSDGNATDVGDLSGVPRYNNCGQHF